MKRAKIYEFEDSNVAGFEWRWTFTLERQPDATFSLSAKQKLIKRDRGDEPFEVEPAEGLTDGNDIYEALCEMLASDFVGEDPTRIDREIVAAKIAKIDKASAEKFLQAMDRDFEEDEDDSDAVAEPNRVTIRSGRLSRSEEIERYKGLDAPKQIVLNKVRL